MYMQICVKSRYFICRPTTMYLYKVERYMDKHLLLPVDLRPPPEQVDYLTTAVPGTQVPGT
eukprot:SAG31_NODE_35_length_31836_cov_10.841352_26_plen_61_part_00